MTQRAVGYIRVSDSSQVEGHSLDAQRLEIVRYCERQGYELVEVYADEGVSAYTDQLSKRPAFSRMLDDAESSRFDVLVVHAIDRFARRASVQASALERLGQAGVGFVSIVESFDFTAPSGKLLLTILSGANEFFSAQQGVHISKSKRRRAELGLPISTIPFGYRIDEPGGVPELELGEEEAVRQVFEGRAAGESMGRLAAQLNMQGLTTRKGHIFTPDAVRDMLGVRFYVGVISYLGEEFPGQHEPIVTEELYRRVQARRSTRRPARRRVHGPKGLLQGRISCGRCGRPVQSDRHRYGRALYRERHGTDCSTNGRTVVANKIDPQVGEVIRALELEPEWPGRMADLAAADEDAKQAARLRDRRRRTSRAYADGAFTDTEYEALLAEIDTHLAQAAAVSGPSLEEAAELFGSVSQLWEEATPEERSELIAPLIDRVYIDLESKRIGAIAPSPAFHALLSAAMRRSGQSDAVLLTADEAARVEVWSSEGSSPIGVAITH